MLRTYTTIPFALTLPYPSLRRTSIELRRSHATLSYPVTQDYLETIIIPGYGTGRLILLGGIQINTPSPMIDYFQPMMFEIRRDDGHVVDLMPESVHK